MICCGKWDDAPNIPGFSGHRSTIVPQIREYWGPSSASLATIPVIGQPPRISTRLSNPGSIVGHIFIALWGTNDR